MVRLLVLLVSVRRNYGIGLMGMVKPFVNQLHESSKAMVKSKRKLMR
jgi:hypothetical protein